ncbi:MAG: hypothetical protein MJZ16_05595 [Bacteroidales bacterium]|nr:hypothetical protein [Bacteroidales bacterium]
MIGTIMDSKSLPIEFKSYSDDKLKELDERMKEREWNSEDTAWERARTLNTKDAYLKYVGMYPYGAHRAQADERLIEINVNDIMNGAHGSLPGMKQVQVDEDSPTSTIVIENFTGYPLTVMYSGPEGRSVTISPGSKMAVTINNGYYRIAATVPAPAVRPFAGTETFSGGRYEVGFHIVRVGF